MIKNRDQIDQAGRAFYWRRNPNESPMIAESTRPDIVIGFREGYEQALRDVKAALEPQESLSSPFKDHRYWSRLKEKVSTQDPAVCEYSGLPPVEYYSSREITIEDIHTIHKEMSDKELEEGVEMFKIGGETDEEKAYRIGWLNGYDEGVYDRENK
jgi:hypothetical protein